MSDNNRYIVLVSIYLFLISFFMLLFNHLNLVKPQGEKKIHEVDDLLKTHWQLNNSIENFRNKLNMEVEKLSLPTPVTKGIDKYSDLSLKIADIYQENEINLPVKNLFNSLIKQFKQINQAANIHFIMPAEINIQQKHALISYMNNNFDINYKIKFIDNHQIASASTAVIRFVYGQQPI